MKERQPKILFSVGKKKCNGTRGCEGGAVTELDSKV